MAMEDLVGEMGNLSGETEDNNITDENQRDTKAKIDNTKTEDLDGLQMLRLPQEDDKCLLRKDEPTYQPKHFEDDKVKCFPVPKQVIREDEEPKVEILTEEAEHEEEQKSKVKHGDRGIREDEVPKAEVLTEENEHEEEEQKFKVEQGDVGMRRIALKPKSVDGAAVKPALVKKEVSELHDRLTERQQKILQDFHVKFVLEGVNVQEDDESRARKHFEFVELKKRLEEEEKMYAGCALGEPSDIIDKDQIEQGEAPADPSSTITARALKTTDNAAAIDEDEDEDVAVRATMDGVINSLAEVAISRPCDSRPEVEVEVDVKPQLRPQNVRSAMKGLADDDDGLSELQEYTNREGSVGCQCCCRKAGKQIDEGDESDVYMTQSSYSVLNVVCPVSGVPVVDLEDPVRSEECEHIYDRSSALNYIASMAKAAFCLCASPGCRAVLAENKLVTDNRLWQDIEELRQIKAAMWESRMLQDFVNIDDSDDD